MKLWLDDLRIPPDDWQWVKTAKEAIHVLESGAVTEISLDHDLGDDSTETGYTVAVWLEEQAAAGNWFRVPEIIRVHSANPVGVQNIKAAIDAIAFARKR